MGHGISLVKFTRRKCRSSSESPIRVARALCANLKMEVVYGAHSICPDDARRTAWKRERGRREHGRAGGGAFPALCSTGDHPASPGKIRGLGEGRRRLCSDRRRPGLWRMRDRLSPRHGSFEAPLEQTQVNPPPAGGACASRHLHGAGRTRDVASRPSRCA